MMDAETKESVEARLGRIAGQVAGIQRMVEQDRYCVDVVTQISAVRAAMAKVSTMLLASHIKTCVAVAFDSHDESERTKKIGELVRVFEKNCNC